MTKTFLAAGKQRGLSASLDDDDAITVETSLRERRRKQVPAGDAPRDLSPCACSDTGSGQDRRGAMDGACGGAGNLMQRGEIEAVARKGATDR